MIMMIIIAVNMYSKWKTPKTIKWLKKEIMFKNFNFEILNKFFFAKKNSELKTKCAHELWHYKDTNY